MTFVVRFFRGLLSGWFFLTYGLLAIFLTPLLLVMSRRAGRGAIRWFYRGFVFLAGVTGLYRVTVGGREKLFVRPGERGRLVVMNHISLIDICVLLAKLGDSVCIAKAATKRNPFLAIVVSRLFIANDQGGERTLAEAKEHLDAGVNVVVFPQGTRGGEKLHRGAARLALCAGADVLPVRIAYDPVVLAKGQPWWDVGAKIIRIRLEVGDVIPVREPNDHRHAVALTHRLATTILAS